MERLTVRNGDTVWYKGEFGGKPLLFEPCEIKPEYEGTSYIKKMLERLASYEDTGLGPDEICVLCSMDRRAKMAEILRMEERREAEERRNKILQDAVQTWGRDAQMLMMIEEMSELTKAICKLNRAGDEESAVAVITNIQEEVEDVQIMLDQMRIMFQSPRNWGREKLDRLGKRLEAAHAENERG